MNKKMIGVVPGPLTVGTASIASADDGSRAEIPKQGARQRGAI